MVGLVGVVWNPIQSQIQSKYNSNHVQIHLRIGESRGHCSHAHQQDPILSFSQMPKSSQVGGWHHPTGNPGSTTVVIDGFWMDLVIHGIYVVKSMIYVKIHGFYAI